MIVFEIEAGRREAVKIDRGVFVFVEDLDGQIQERIRTFDHRGEEIGHTRRGSAAFDFLSRKEKTNLLRGIRDTEAGRVQRVGEIRFRHISESAGEQ